MTPRQLPMSASPAEAMTTSRVGRGTACWVKFGPVTERAAVRVPFDETVVVTPWDIATAAPAGPSLLAGGRNLSTGGISFSHVGLLPHRHVAVSFPGTRRDEEGGPVIETLIVRLIWCRFTRRGIYLSGGRFEGTLGDAFGRPLATLLGSTAG